MPAGRLSRWIVVLGALFAVALFSGSSCGESRLTTTPIITSGACPNVILQASLPGLLPVEAGSVPDDSHLPGDTIAGTCLFVVMALAALALAGGLRGPLLVFRGFWWARLPLALQRIPAVSSSRQDELRI
jgi:hypothetical protein